MKIINKRKKDIYNYYKLENVYNICDLVVDYLTNKENININNLHKLINYFYDIIVEDNDYLEYFNNANNKNFTKIIDIPTEEVIQDMHSEGHGRDFSWWTQNYQIYVSALSDKFVPTKEEYTFDEIKELISQGQICALYRYRKETKKCQNIIRDSFKCMVKYPKAKITEETEYYEYMVRKALLEITLENLINEIRVFIIRLKFESQIIDFSYIEEKDGNKVKKKIVDKLITLFNKNEKEKIKLSEVEIVIDYLKKLPNTENWYQELTLDHIINAFSFIDAEKDKELCKQIEELVISLNEAELCYEMASNIEWIDKEKMAEIVIASGDPYFNYYYAAEVEGADVKRHKEVILNSKHSDEYILERAKSLSLTK